MTEAEFQLLTTPQVKDFVEKNLNKNVTALALSRKGNAQFPALVYSQIKNLQKSEKKIPSYFHVKAILPTRAFEQCSSEATAALKDISGNIFVDLTCGLGVDSTFLSKKFQSGIALEADPVLAQITTLTYEKLGISHVQIKNQRAEDFLQTYTGPSIDLIYADPDRRDEQGSRQILLDKIQPNILDLLPLIRQHSKRLLVKLSPLFDLAEAERHFRKDLYRLVVVSVDNECKEIWVDCMFEADSKSVLTEIKTFRKGHLTTFSFPQVENDQDTILGKGWEDYYAMYPQTRYIWEPDVAFYKARKTIEFVQQMKDVQGHFNHPEGYFFSTHLPPDGFPGRVFEIKQAFPFHPKKIKKAVGKEALHISKRYTDQSTKILRTRLGVKEGGERFLLCTTWEKRLYAYLCEVVN